MISDADLERFIDEALPPQAMAALEAALRDDDALKARVLAAVGRRDAGIHALSAVWRRHRLSCLSREQLGSHLLGVLDSATEDYVRFHLDVVECRICRASVEDLREQAVSCDRKSIESRRTKYFQSSAGYLEKDAK